MRLRRFICPVGQGCYSIENIGKYVVAYDCGSTSSPEMVEECIDHLSDHFGAIDILFISHFDKDHVNGIRYLLNNIRVIQAVTAFIPSELKTAFGVYTGGAYSAITDLLNRNEVVTREVGDSDNGIGNFNYRSIWEWIIAKSMMDAADFSKIKTFLVSNGIDKNRLQDPVYVEINKAIINGAFKSAFGGKGPNAKGLIMLSQPCVSTVTLGSDVRRGCPLCFYRIKRRNCSESSCLYVGDADLKNNANLSDVKAFLQRNRTEDSLLLMQIPHHGSSWNISPQFEIYFPSRYYFVNDESSNRLQKTPLLFNSLTSQNKLLVSRSSCYSMIMSVTIIQ